MRVGLRDRGFRCLLWAQALSAFNDNAFKTFVALTFVAGASVEDSGRVVALSGACFFLPFLLFSTLAGSTADRISKKRLIVLCKAAEVVLMLLAGAVFYSGSVPATLALLLGMGVHSAFFGPAKMAILPEILDDKDLSRANGLVQMTTFMGILLGTVAAGLMRGAFSGTPGAAGAVLAAVAAVGLLVSLGVPPVEAAGSREPLPFDPFSKTLENLRCIRLHHGVFLALAGSAYFWFLGAIFQMNILVYGKELMGVSERTLSYFQMTVALGIGAGSYLAGRLSREKVELGLVPLGALGLVAFSFDLAFSFRSEVRTLVDLSLLGVSGGCFIVPLEAFVQQRSPKDQRGKFIATGNVLSMLGVLSASACLWAFSGHFRLHPGQIFLVVSLMTLAVAAFIVCTLPDFLLRLVFYPVANLVYRIVVEGRQNLPIEGPALLVSNHVAFVDAFLISGASPRLIRFLMFRSYYELPVLKWFFKAMGVIPISDRDSPKAVLHSFDAAREALRRGEAVCIFAEGELTRHGQMNRFKKGFEKILEGLDVPVIPVHLDRVWGSIFSYEGGRVFLKWPRRLPYPVTVSFGRPMPSTSKAQEVRAAIQELGAEAFKHRLAEKRTLPRAFAREAKRHWARPALADSSGARLGAGPALVGAWLLGRELDRLAPSGGAVGLLIPPSVGGALANAGLSLMGRMPVNLNYTTSRELVLSCAARAGARKIVASRKMLKKLGWEPSENMVFIEDAAAGIPAWKKAAAAAAFYLLPARLLEALFFPKAPRSLEEPATVIFTSGSTGEPKGVVLSHANIHANIESLGQVYQVGASDAILGALPFFHSFGFTVTLWFPLVAGFGVVYHHNPLEAKRIGELIAQHGVTFLLGTPTFLLGYLKRVEPGQLKSLRFAVAGAEKLREEVSQAFEEKFGLRPLEGYGCTELSPVACLNIPDAEAGGVRQRGGKTGTIGQPLPGVTVKVVDPDTGAPLPENTPGLLLVKGPNVMKGYLDDPERTAAAMRDGYYVTGDIASIDLDGFVSITDRLSRFSKIGGEMVPHVRLEEKLHQLAGRIEQTFVVTAVPDEKRGERLVVLYKDLEGVEALHKGLSDSDLPKLWLPDKASFHKVQEFPLLGTGKLDMQRLKAVAHELEKTA